MRLGFITTVLVFSMAICAARGETGQGRVAPHTVVPSHVVVRGETISLADLLPGTAPASLRAQARNIPLGESPQPAMCRVIYRQQLQYLLHDRAPLLAEMTLPPQIIVERSHRALTKKEVIRAIQTAVGQQGINGARGLDLQDVQFSTPVYVTTGDPGLKVIRIDSDPLRDETRFRLWTSEEPANLPFEVSAPGVEKLPALVSRRALAPGEIVSATDFSIVMKSGAGIPSGKNPSAAELSGLETRVPLRAGDPVTRTEFGMPVLVRPGALASLIIQGEHFSIKTVVTPLEQGVLGQEVKARNIESRQVIEAKVIGRDRLLKER